MNIALLISLMWLTSHGSVLPAAPVTGDYVEARTCSVFAGACHYNGELVTAGHEAVAAIHFSGGYFHGVNLAGVKAMVAVQCADNLSVVAAPRRWQLMVDPAASAAQCAAVRALLEARCGATLGQLDGAGTAAIAFAKNDRNFDVSAKGFGSIAIAPMPDDECCKQPNLVWYSPLMPLVDRKVGYTEKATYTAGAIGDPWQRGDENSAFYGHFSF